jgi:hypothetical protein
MDNAHAIKFLRGQAAKLLAIAESYEVNVREGGERATDYAAVGRQTRGTAEAINRMADRR